MRECGSRLRGGEEGQLVGVAIRGTISRIVSPGFSAAEFGRTMTAMSAWVAGGAGNCAYCHNTANFAADSNKGQPIYTKLVARMMLRMTRRVNADYAQHVGGTGVTCYTCHRGQPLPNGLWFYTDQNQILRHYLDRDDIRVQSHTIEPLPGEAANRTAIRQTYNTYALMVTQSKALGVNCTYCHNSRAWTNWEESTPKRVVALYGAAMLRDINMNYLNPLQPVYPRSRLGEHGDAPKAQCVTCHNGVYKPMYGAKMVKDYPALWGARVGTPRQDRWMPQANRCTTAHHSWRRCPHRPVPN
ncbi:MAG: photosynthetic reaction center cytochrome c subunit [Aquincola sp.]|nr:photosynthetic reaction center cytochrome c subunit [Aquincola sp.]